MNGEPSSSAPGSSFQINSHQTSKLFCLYVSKSIFNMHLKQLLKNLLVMESILNVTSSLSSEVSDSLDIRQIGWIFEGGCIFLR